MFEADDEKNTDFKLHGSSASSGPSEPGKSKILPAPAPMIATVANAMMSYPLVVPNSAVEIAPARGKKRTMGSEAATEENSEAPSPTDALAWISQTPPENRDETIGDSVNRHCKIRFVERMANVIVKTEKMDSNYMAPQKDDEKVTIATVKTVPEPIALVPLGEAYTIDDTTLEQVGGLEIFNEQGIKNLDDEQLETLLDSFLIRMIQSVIDSITDEESLRAELNSQDKSGFALLHYAALYNLKSLVPILFKKGANPNVQTLNKKLTPLHFAAGAGNFAMVESLVMNGATIDPKDSRALTPRCHARQNGFPEVAAWLRQQKTDDDDDLISSDGSVHTTKTEGSDDVGRIVVQAAFKNLNLKEKIILCLLSGKMKEEPVVQLKNSMEQGTLGKLKSPPRALLAGTRTKQKTQNGIDADININHFMTPQDRKSIDVAMSLMSEGELQELTSSTAQHNARSWLVKNSYESMQLVPEKKKGSLNQTKLSQVLASLVIRKQFLAKQAQKRETFKTL